MMAPMRVTTTKNGSGNGAGGLDGEITLRYATSGHAMDESFKSFVDQVADLAPRIQAKKDGDAMVSLPTLFIGSHVAYQALPLDRELEPFLGCIG
jgi:hypothetical protein